jgi:hypothetical protein
MMIGKSAHSVLGTAIHKSSLILIFKLEGKGHSRVHIKLGSMKIL